PVVVQPAFKLEGTPYEERCYATEIEAHQSATRTVLQRKQLEQRGGEWAMNDQVRVSLFVARVGLIVMDAVSVGGQGGIAKEKCCIRLEGAAPLSYSVITLRLRRGSGGCDLAIDDVLLLGDTGRPVAARYMLDRYERQRASLAGLVLNLEDPAAPRG